MLLNRLIGLFNNWNWYIFRAVVRIIIVSGIFLVSVPAARPDLSSNQFQAVGIARDYLFDFAGWEVDALLDKASNAVLNPQQYMSEEERVQFVREYLTLVADVLQLERQVEDVYIDPQITDPAAASVEIRAERDALRAELDTRQALAEAIIQSHTSEFLAEYGLATAGQILPPLSMRFTQLPTMLILSRRDRIERIGSYPLEHGLTIDQKDQLETDVDTELDVSSLIVPLGGLAVYPAMMIESSNLVFVYEVAAHEWAHHYLSFYPLGFNYGTTPEMFTINETVASIIGNEITYAVTSRYYPDLAPAAPDYTPEPPAEIEQSTTPDQEPAFDFREEMRITRIQVDELLAAGQIEEAEAYMEARRLVFLENGYRIRKINQAYFAFHGSYADQPGSSGADPIGPAIRELRYYSPSLKVFIEQMRGVTSFSELQTLLDEARQNHD